MKNWHYITTAAAVYLVSLLLLVPASSLLSLVELPKQLKIDGISGSLWSGQASQLQFKQNKLSNIYWSLSPLPLLLGNISSDVQADIFNNTINTNISTSFSGKQLSLHDLTAKLNASDLQKQLNLPFGELEGTLTAKADQVIIENKKLPVVTALVSWKDARLTLANSISFGDLFLRIAPDDNNGLKGDISNLRGQLSIKGNLTVSDKQIYSLNVKLKPRANAPAELISMLNLIAPKKKNGEHIVNRSGHLRQLGIKL